MNYEYLEIYKLQEISGILVILFCILMNFKYTPTNKNINGMTHEHLKK